MKNRFSVRKIKVNSYSERFAVYDSMWKDVAHANDCSIWGGKQYMYIRYTEWNNKDFVKAVAEYLNQTIGDDITKHIDGYRASYDVILRDVGTYENGYSKWCNKFSTGFRPAEKFQKV